MDDAQIKTVKLLMQIVISIFVLSVAFYIIITSEKEDSKKFAIGLIGTILGFWLNESI